MTEIQNLIEHLKEFVLEERYARFLKVLENRTRHLTIALEDIFQSHNASAVLRSCECLGIQDIHLIENRYSFEVHPDIVLGSNKWLSLYRYNKKKNNTNDCLLSLKKKGYSIVATSPHTDGFSPSDLPIDKPIALVFGTELEGITNEAKNHADHFLQIPMMGFTESYNISVSAGICLYELSKRIRTSVNLSWQLRNEEKEILILDWLKKSIKNPQPIIKRFQKKTDKLIDI
jgi:tRNA (guanosine-2'-O-)-methyltransferase